MIDCLVIDGYDNGQSKHENFLIDYMRHFTPFGFEILSLRNMDVSSMYSDVWDALQRYTVTYLIEQGISRDKKLYLVWKERFMCHWRMKILIKVVSFSSVCTLYIWVGITCNNGKVRLEIPESTTLISWDMIDEWMTIQRKGDEHYYRYIS